MPDSSKNASALLKAAAKGDERKLQELLAKKGVPLEATDPNGLTPVMRAAQAGQLGAFRLLVKAGADLQTLGLDDTDLLECATEGGNIEIVQFLLDEGHPIEGRWVPRFKADARMGHMTPLFLAAINGHVEAVRLLLQAGANREAKFDGETALRIVQGNIKYPLDDQVALVPQYKMIAALLSGGATSPQDPSAEEVKRFAENAKRSEYQQLRESLTKRFGKPTAWKPQPDHGLPAKGVIRFKIRADSDPQVLDEAQREARRAGCHLLFEEGWEPGEKGTLVLFPTDDKLAVVAAVGTEGENHSISTADILAWLKSTNEENPFDLLCCAHDLIGAIFLQKVKLPKKLATKIVDICPDYLGEETATIDELTKLLKKQQSFLLWWG
jgi:hypothetical protein